MRGLFVTATDTGVGKTILSAALLAAMTAAGERVRAFKPAVTGLGDAEEIAARGEWPADHELLAAMAGMSPEQVAPLRYAPAVSPHLAARLAGERIDVSELLAYACGDSGGVHDDMATTDGGDEHDAALEADDGDRHDTALVAEGVGGLLVPLREDYSVCDLAVALGLPVLIAARPGLGTINHTLLTLRVARGAGLDVRAVVLTPWPERPSVLESSNRETIAQVGEVEVATLGHVESPARADLAHAGATLAWRRWLALDEN
jgi:dethiobiotin synthetase